MPDVPQPYTTATLTNAAESAANTETVVCTLSGVTTRFAGLTIRLSGWVQLTPGTTATSITLRLRRGSLTGTLVGPQTAESGNVVASKISDLTVEAEDAPGEVTGFTYVMTAQGAGEGTACTFQAGTLRALVS